MGDLDERKLFVGKLPEDITEEDIRHIFGTYGKIAEIKLLDKAQQRPGQAPQLSAFVSYESVSDARTAIQVLNNVYKFREDADEPVYVNVARSKGGPGGRDGSGGGRDRSYGGYADTSRGRDSYARYDGRERGSDRERDFDRGSYDRTGYDRGGYDRGGGYYDRDYKGNGKGSGPDRGGSDRYDRGYSDRGSDRGGSDRGYDRGYSDRGGYDRGYDRHIERDRSPRRETRERGPVTEFPRDLGRGVPGKKLYVANLPPDITKEALEYVFKNYGRLEDVFIMTGRSDTGQSGAFIVYQSASDAKTCLNAMSNGYEIRPGEGNILVKFADGDKKGGKGKGKGKR